MTQELVAKLAGAVTIITQIHDEVIRFNELYKTLENVKQYNKDILPLINELDMTIHACDTEISPSLKMNIKLLHTIKDTNNTIKGFIDNDMKVVVD